MDGQSGGGAVPCTASGEAAPLPVALLQLASRSEVLLVDVQALSKTLTLTLILTRTRTRTLALTLTVVPTLALTCRR